VIQKVYRPEVNSTNIMGYRKITCFVLLLATYIVAQETEDKKGTFNKKLPVRLGSDGRPLLFAPKIEMCVNRTSHGKLGKHHYFLSWREPWNKFEDWDWFNARNFCRERCMDLVSFETAHEFQMFKEVMIADNITSIYTSGRKCNFQGKGCDAAHFQPINVNGWFWTGAGNARLPPTNVDNKNTFWSKTGQSGKHQPDNHDGLKAGKLRKVSDPVGLTIEGLQEWHDEACLAVLNNQYNDGVTWHDVPCHFRSKLVCEDSDDLLSRAARENPGVTIPEPVAIKN